MKKIISLLTCLVLIFTMSLGLVSCADNNESAIDPNAQNYEKALVMLANGDYPGAQEAFEKLGDYRDSKDYLAKFYYMPTSFEYDLIGKKGAEDVLYNNINLPSRQFIMRSDAQAIYEYEYDGNGNVIKQTVKKNGAEGHEVSVYEYTYDENNRRVKAEFTFYGVASGFNTFTYDEKGNLIRQTQEDSQGLLALEYVMSYDEKGNRTRIETIFGDESEVTNISYQFDENGRAVKETSTYSDGSSEVWDYTYDEKGNRTSAVFTDYNGDKCRYDYTYDEHGNVVKEEYTGTDGVKEYVAMEYALMYLPCGVTEGTEAFFTDLWASRL